MEKRLFKLSFPNGLARKFAEDAENQPLGTLTTRTFATRGIPGLRAHLLATTALALTALPAAAQTTSFRVSSGSWFTAANWSNGVPNAGTQQTNVSTPGTAQIAGAAAFGGSALLISNGSTVVIQPGGSLTMSPNGAITLNGGSLRSTTNATIDGTTIQFRSSSSLGAAAGQTLNIGGAVGSTLDVNGASVINFGSASDTGTVNIGKLDFIAGATQNNYTVAINGGVLRSAHPGVFTLSATLADLTTFATRTIVAAGATLDFNGQLDPHGGFGRPGISNLLGAGNVVIMQGTGSQLKVQSGDFSGIISGDAGLLRTDLVSESELTGLGNLLTLSGKNTYTGPTTIDGGSLIVNGSIVSNVTVNTKGILGGTGVVNDVFVGSQGFILPGNPGTIGALTSKGQVRFSQDSFFGVDVNAAGRSDFLNTAKADLAGRVLVTPQTGSYQPVTRYLILSASGLNGTFASVGSSASFLAPSLTYDANNVFLTLTRVPIGSLARTANELSVGAALDQFPTDDPVFLAVAALPGGEQRWGAFDALSGEVHASTHSVLIDESRYVRQAMLSRLRTANFADATGTLAALALGGPATFAALPGDSERYTADMPTSVMVPPIRRDFAMWAHGYGAWGNLGGNLNAANVDRRSGGFATGVDTGAFTIGPFNVTRLGIAGGYAQSDIDVKARASSAKVETGQLGAYWSTNLLGLNFRSGAALALHSIDTSRFIAFPGFTDTARATYDGWTAQSFFEVAYGFSAGPVAVEPFAGLTSVWVKTDAFRELGGPAALTGRSESTDATYSTAGARLAVTRMLGGMSVTARGTLAWQHAFGDIKPDRLLAFQSNANAFGIHGVPIARDALLAEAGLDLRITPNAVLGVTYSGQLAQNVQDHAVRGTLAIRF